MSGRELNKGDTVATLSGGVTGRVCEMAVEHGEPFVLLRPAHQPYGPGVWHPADQVNRVAEGRVRTRTEPGKPATAGAGAKGGAKASAGSASRRKTLARKK